MVEPLLTVEQVAAWRRRLEEIQGEQQRLNEERSEIHRKLEAVSVLFGDLDFPKEDDAPAEQRRVAVRESGDKPSWPSEIVRIFDEKHAPLSFDDLKAELEKGPLEGEYAKSEKGFYHAVSRLQKKGYLAKHRGWLIRVSDLHKHKANVRDGLVDELPDITNQRRSPMGEEVLALLKNKPRGVRSSEIINHLKGDDRFRDTLNKNATSGYNVIARLLKRGEIRKEGYLYYPLNENEASADGSESDKGDTGKVSPLSSSQLSLSGA